MNLRGYPKIWDVIRHSPEAVQLYYKDFRKLPVSKQIILGIAAYNFLVGAAVGGSYFVIANAAAREFLFDAALHFLNTYALNSDSKLINAIAFTGNIARMLQIDHVLHIGTSTVPLALNFIDSSINHPVTLAGFGGAWWMKWFGKSESAAKKDVSTPQTQHELTTKKAM